EEGITGRVSSDTEEIRMDKRESLQGGIDVPTGSYSIPTTDPPAVDIHTGSDVVSTAKEQQEREDKRMTEQIARDAEVARIHAEEELQVRKLVEDFIPMGSKEEAKRLKRKGFNLEQEKAKK
nr:hypothetical protein [Tanacetum cinerariifolium]